MNHTLNRRAFLGSTLAFGSLLLAGRALAASAAGSAAPAAKGSLASVKGLDTIAATRRALELVGGMGSVIKPGQKVGLLINAPKWWTKPGSFTSPEVVLAVIAACLEAGAGEIEHVIDPAGDYFRRTPLSSRFEKEIAAVKHNTGTWRPVDLPKGRIVKKATMNSTFLDCDVLINIPIAKHHAGTGYTGALKNVMGACNRDTNKAFHEAPGAKGEYDDAGYLSQCIADINTVRKPDLVVCDGVEFLLTNGPAGPGELRRSNTVIAGRDPVAVDALGCTLLGRKPSEIVMLSMAEAHGVGHIQPAAPGLVEISL